MWTVLCGIFYQKRQKLQGKQTALRTRDIGKKAGEENEYMPSIGFQSAIKPKNTGCAGTNIPAIVARFPEDEVSRL